MLTSFLPGSLRKEWFIEGRISLLDEYYFKYILISPIFLWTFFFFFFPHCTGSSLWYAGSLLWHLQASLTVVCGLWLQCTGLVAPQHVGIIPQRDQTHIPCVGRQIINHWLTIRKVSEPHIFFFYISEPYMWIMIDQILAGS